MPTVTPPQGKFLTGGTAAHWSQVDARIMLQHLSQMTDADLAALEARLIASKAGADADQMETTIQGGILIVALSMILLNLVTDLLYAVADPRIRYD